MPTPQVNGLNKKNLERLRKIRSESKPKRRSISFKCTPDIKKQIDEYCKTNCCKKYEVFEKAISQLVREGG